MRVRRNTLVAKWFSHRGKPLVSTWLLSNGGKWEHYTGISCDGPYFSCLFGVKWDGGNICWKRVVLQKLCSEETDPGAGLVGESSPGRQVESCQALSVSLRRGYLLVCNVCSMGAPWWLPWVGLDQNSQQYWLPKSSSINTCVCFAEHHTRQASVYLHVLSVWQVKPPGDLGPFEL